MMVTTGQAQVLRCCGPLGCGNVHAAVYNSTRFCVGDQCMAWQWIDPIVELRTTRATFDGHVPPDGNGWALKSPGIPGEEADLWERPHPARRGRCGLAAPSEPSEISP